MRPRGHVLQSSLPVFSVWYSVSLLQKKCQNPNFFPAIWNIDICAAFCELQGFVVLRSRSILKHVLLGNLVKFFVQGGRMAWWGRTKCVSFCLHSLFCHVEKQLSKEEDARLVAGIQLGSGILALSCSCFCGCCRAKNCGLIVQKWAGRS